MICLKESENCKRKRRGLLTTAVSRKVFPGERRLNISEKNEYERVGRGAYCSPECWGMICICSGCAVPRRFLQLIYFYICLEKQCFLCKIWYNKNSWRRSRRVSKYEQTVNIQVNPRKMQLSPYAQPAPFGLAAVLQKTRT